MEIPSPTLGKKPKRETEEVPRSPLLPRNGADVFATASPVGLLKKGTGLRKVSTGAGAKQRGMTDKELATLTVEERAMILAGVSKDEVSFRSSLLSFSSALTFFVLRSGYLVSKDCQEDAPRGRGPPLSLLEGSRSKGPSLADGRDPWRVFTSLASFSSHLSA